MTEPCGIILAAHGSRHPGAMAALDAFRESVAAAHPGAVVAVARKLGVLLHCLWKTGGAYEPNLRKSRKTKAA